MARACTHPKRRRKSVWTADPYWGGSSAVEWCTLCGALSEWNVKGSRTRWIKPATRARGRGR